MLLNFKSLGDGPNIILMHGLLGSSTNLGTLASSFSTSNRVFNLDLRNHGQSPHIPSMSYEDMASDVHELIIQEEIQQPILIGHSMGGKVAMTLGLQYPDLIRALVILDIAPVKYDSDFHTLIKSLQTIDLSIISDRKQADSLLALDVEEPAFRQFLLQNLIRDASGFKWRVNLDIIADAIPTIINFPDMKQKTFAHPSLFIGGGNSDYIKESDKPTIRNYFPSALIQTIPETGHWLHAEKTDEVVSIIEQFLQDI